jgi:hypothetical protein
MARRCETGYLFAMTAMSRFQEEPMYRTMMLSLSVMAILLAAGLSACTVTEGQPVDFDALGLRNCETDAECKPYAFCGDQGKCVFECRTKEDCYLFMPEEEGYKCVDNQCRTADWEPEPDGDVEDGDSDDDGAGCAPTPTDIDCRYWNEDYCTERSWVPWCAASDCLVMGWQYTCGEEGKCIDNCAVDFGEVEEYPELADWTGVWGTVYSTAVTTTGLPLVNSQDTVSYHYSLDRLSIRDGKIVRDSKLCFLAIKNFKGEQIFDEDLAFMVTPQAYWENVALIQQVIENPEPMVAGLTFETTRFWEVRGAILDDPINDDLPDRDDYNMGDPRIWDQDFDGKPAMTTLMKGVINMEIYSDQRWSTVMEAEVVDMDHIIAINNHTSLQYQLDTHNHTNLYDQATKPHDDGDRSYYRMLRMPDDTTCEDVMALREEVNGWLYFTPRMDGVPRPE